MIFSFATFKYTVHCLIPDLRQEALNFSLLSVIHAVGLSYVGFIVLRHVPYVLILLRVFTLNRF